MSETFFKVSRSDFVCSGIKKVVVDRQTESSVWIDGRRLPRITSYTCYFHTWDEAKDDLLKRAERNTEMIRRQLERANGLLGNVKGLKNPEGDE